MFQEEFKIDIETFSPIDLTAAGVFKYCQHPQFQILLFAYKDITTGKVECIDMVKNPVLPGWIIEKLLNPKVRKVAHNAMFEMACISSYLMTMMITDDPLDPAEWSCSAARATSRGFPLSLEAIAQVMHLQTQKDKRGYQLIRYFCMPTKEGKRNYPKDNPDGWKQFIEYCKTDVIVEDEICQKLGKYDLTDDEQRLWILDQKINTTGVRIDKKFVINNIKFNVQFKDELAEEATRISGLSKPNSVAQLKKYIQAENDSDEPITTLDKKAIQKLLKADDINDTVRRLLEIREMSGKSSMKKYHTMLESMCDDGRVKGMFQYCGANRTGRWCLAEGSLITVKNYNGEIELVPIEQVSTTDQVFDGDNWVNHEGVVFSGDKDVITHDNITATKDHLVFLDNDTKIKLEDAKNQNQNLWKGNFQSINLFPPQVEFM